MTAIQPYLLSKKTVIVGALRTGGISGTTITATGAEINKLAGNAVTAADLTKLNGVTSSAAELNATDGVTGALMQTQAVLFTETGAGTYTGTIALPAGSVIADVQVHGLAVWNAGTSASMIVGDGTDPDGFYVATDVKATDLLLGEANTIEHPGGKAGAYIVSEQRQLYAAGARNVIGVITSVGAGTLGRTLLVVHYSVPTVANATKV